MVYYKRISAIPKKLLAKVLEKRQLTDVVWEVLFGFENEITPKPGQYVSLKVTDGGLRRSYSLSGIEGKKIELLVDVEPMGAGSKKILSLLVGDEVEMIGPLGNFVVESEVLELPRIVFVATGTGVAPYWPMVTEVLEKGFRGEVKLVWGMRYIKDLYWQEKWLDLQRKHNNFEFKMILSQPEGAWPVKPGHVGDVIQTLGDFASTGVFLCGSRDMIEDTKKQVEEKGAKDEYIYYEKFY